MSLALSTCVLFISYMQLVNGAQFLNATPLSHSSACLVHHSSAPSSAIVIVPLTRIFASL